MNSHNIGFNWAPGEHPSLELLRQYQSSALSPEAEHQVERHLLTCDLCADVAEGMAVPTPAQTQVAVQVIHARLRILLSSKEKKKPALLWYDWRAAAAILVLLCSLVLVIYQQFSQITEAPNTFATAPKPPILQKAEPPLVGKANTAPVLEERNQMQEEATFKPSSPPVAYQNSKKSIKFTPPVVKKEEEVLLAKTEEVLEEKPMVPTVADAPAPQAVAKKASDTLLDPNQPVLVSKLKAEEGNALPMARKSSSTKPQIVIRGSASLPTATAKNSLQLVSGKVVASDGEGLPGVTVQLKGTTQTVATDAQGNFNFPVADPKATLVFNYIGFLPKEITIKGETVPLEVKLQEDFRALSEVVVVGYGSQRRSEVTASTAVVSAKPVAGLGAFRKYIKKYLRYPQAAQRENVKGRVVVKFTVSANGQMENLQVVKSLCSACDAEAIRLIKEGPAWQPAIKNGTPAPQQVKVTIRFKPE